MGIGILLLGVLAIVLVLVFFNEVWPRRWREGIVENVESDRVNKYVVINAKGTMVLVYLPLENNSSDTSDITKNAPIKFKVNPDNTRIHNEKVLVTGKPGDKRAVVNVDPKYCLLVGYHVPGAERFSSEYGERTDV